MSEIDRGAKHNARVRAEQARDERVRKNVIMALMSQSDGRRFIWLELSTCHCFGQTYIADSFDRTAFQEGQRSRGLKLLDDVTRWAPEHYILMTKENSSVQLKEEPEDDG